MWLDVCGWSQDDRFCSRLRSQEGEGAELGHGHLGCREEMGSKLFGGEPAGACNLLDEGREEGKTRKTPSHPDWAREWMLEWAGQAGSSAGRGPEEGSVGRREASTCLCT